MEMAIALGTQVVLMVVYYAIPIHSIVQNAGFVTLTMDSSSPKIYAVTPTKGSFPLEMALLQGNQLLGRMLGLLCKSYIAFTM